MGIGSATADGFNRSIINPAMSGTDTLTNQNVLGQTNGKQYAALHYDANGGSGTMASQSGAVGSSVSLEQNGFSRPGYRFTGWNTKADGSGTTYQPGASITIIDGTRTLYAQWVMSVNSLPMTGGHGSFAPLMVGLIVSCAAIATAAVAAWRKRSRNSE